MRPPFRPVNALARQLRIRFLVGAIHSNPHFLKPLTPSLRHGKRPPTGCQQNSVALQSIRNLHPEPARQVCVARPCMRQRPNLGHSRLTLATNTRQHHQRFHRIRNLRICQPIITMPPLLLHPQQSALNKLG